MLEDEDNRSCNDNCCEIKNPPNIPMYSFEFTNVSDAEDNCCDRKKTKCEMLDEIRSLSFAVVELAEYLDTHPDDRRALVLHREYANKLHDLKEKYQMVYGPLTINFPCNKWRWLEGPWPWERGNC